MAAAGVTYESVMRDLRKKEYFPVYYLMGEEDFFIDRICDYIEDNVLTETEKDFNLTVVYGSDIDDFAQVVNLAKRYPMMAEHQVVIVKEAQNISNMDALEVYLEKPQPATLLVICHKHGVLDRRKKLASVIMKKGVLFESKRWRDNQLPSFVTDYLQTKKVTADHEAVEILCEHVGTDLSRMVTELDKLIISVDEKTRCITPDLVEKNTGISKDYNNFELQHALQTKNVLKANTIIHYFSQNPKANPLQMTLAVLFKFYANLMIAFYAPDKSQQGIASFLGLRNLWQANDYVEAMRYYNAWHVMRNISLIRRADAASKGVDASNMLSDEDNLRELVFKLLH
jgi:DNA polymerase III subunit delta